MAAWPGVTASAPPGAYNRQMLSLETCESIGEIDASDWDQLAADDNPFVSHAFLAALEETHCIRREFGWRPRHLSLREDGALVGALPLYIKANSHGEYVFDWAWADAWERAGGTYYPKLLCAVPYSPVTGPRLLAGSGLDAAANRVALALALGRLTGRLRFSSAHVDFLTEAETHAFGSDWLARSDWQFQWNNPGDWRDFQDYLDALTHKRRTATRHERAMVADAGLTCEFRDGGSLSDDEWRTFHHLYTHTFDEKGNTPTLTLDFFRRLGAVFPARSHVALARRGGEIVAGAFFLSSAHTLYGRYWGAFEPVSGLHFELCYYQGIEYCLRHGLRHFEPGAQGLHKLARGFLPARTWSMHYIADPGFRAAVRAALEREAVLLDARGRELRAHSPFALHQPPA